MTPAQSTEARLGIPSPDSGKTGVSVRNLGKRYWLHKALPPTLQDTLLAVVRGAGATPFWALQDVSFNLGPGESLGIIGANGAGKSTLLRLMCGLGRPTTGQVDVTGRLAALLELGAGFHPHLTGRDNLYVSAIIGGLRRREVRVLFDEIVDFAELRDFIDQPLRTYSSGMQMRLGFSVAVHVDPAVMIIDEALSVGDGHFQRKCLDRIEAFRRAGKTLVMVSHSMDTIRAFCTRTLWLRRGAVVGDGPTKSIVPQYEAVMQREILSETRDQGGALTGS
jgi:lipopolysaccharide transport system ATP-binding protein